MMTSPTVGLIIAVLCSFSPVFPVGRSQGVSPTQQQFLLITPAAVTHTKSLGSSLVLTCSLHSPFVAAAPSDDTYLARPFVRWRGPDMEYISDTRGRVHIEQQDSMSVRLYVNLLQQSDMGLYSCESDYDGELLSNETELFIFEGIRFANTSTRVDQKLGLSAIMECAAFGKPTPVLSWRFGDKKIEIDGVKYSLVKETSLRINDIQRTDNGTYQCRAEVDSFGQLQVRHVELNVLYAPVLSETPQVSHTIIKGMEITLRCVADGNPAVKYEWYKERKMSDMAKVKVPLVTSDPKKYVIESMNAADEGRYLCRVSNRFGTREAFVDINMLVRPELRPLLPERRTVEGGTLLASCEATGVPEPYVHWTKVGSDSALVDGPQPDDPDVRVDRTQPTSCRLVIQNVRRSHGGNFTCTGTNDVGQRSSTVRVIVEYQPSFIVGTNPLEPEVEETQYSWPGQQRRFICTALGLPQPTVTWIRNNQPIANSEFYRVTTNTSTTDSGFTTSSMLEVIAGDKQHWLYGSYTCVAKNYRGHTKKVFHLIEAEVPEPPANVTVVDQSATTVTLNIADHPAFQTSISDAIQSRPPVVSWLTEYVEEFSSVEVVEQNETRYQTQHNSIVFQNDGTQYLRIVNLAPDTIYMFHLSAGNAVGFSDKIKFRVRTSKTDLDEQSDGPVRGHDGNSEAFLLHRNALEKRDGALTTGAHGDGTRAGLYAGVIIGVMAALAVAVALSVGAAIRLRRTHLTTNGTFKTWYSGVVCCNLELHTRREDTTNKSDLVVRRRGTGPLDRLMFWKRWSTQSPEMTQQAGTGWPISNETTKVHVEQVLVTSAENLPDKSDGVPDPAVSKLNESPRSTRARLHSPLMSGRQQRAPGTPPPSVFRSPSGRVTTPSAHHAWKCLKSPPYNGNGSAETPGSSPTGPLGSATSADGCIFPERDWQLRTFLESPVRSSSGRNSRDEERCYNDVLDGYHSEDNIDENDDNDIRGDNPR